MRINGGYFVLRQDIFDYLDEDEDLVMDACVARRRGQVRAVPYDGFWAPMDTLKERTALEDMYRHGESPWALWRSDRAHCAQSHSPHRRDLPGLTLLHGPRFAHETAGAAQEAVDGVRSGG